MKKILLAILLIPTLCFSQPGSGIKILNLPIVNNCIDSDKFIIEKADSIPNTRTNQITAYDLKQYITDSVAKQKDSALNKYGTVVVSSGSVPTISSIAPGTGGYVYTSNGTAAMPSFQPSSTSGGGGIDTNGILLVYDSIVDFNPPTGVIILTGLTGTYTPGETITEVSTLPATIHAIVTSQSADTLLYQGITGGVFDNTAPIVGGTSGASSTLGSSWYGDWKVLLKIPVYDSAIIEDVIVLRPTAVVTAQVFQLWTGLAHSGKNVFGSDPSSDNLQNLTQTRSYINNNSATASFGTVMTPASQIQVYVARTLRCILNYTQALTSGTVPCKAEMKIFARRVYP